MKQNCIAIGYRGVGVQIEDTWGDKENWDARQQVQRLRLGLSLAVPREKEATALIQLMEELTEYLLMVPNTLHFSGVEFGEMFYQQELDSFCCDGSAEVSLSVYEQKDTEEILEFEVKRSECV